MFILFIPQQKTIIGAPEEKNAVAFFGGEKGFQARLDSVHPLKKIYIIVIPSSILNCKVHYSIPCNRCYCKLDSYRCW